MSSLCRGHANLLCIVPIFSYASPKGAIDTGRDLSWQLKILILSGPRVCHRILPNTCFTRQVALVPEFTKSATEMSTRRNCATSCSYSEVQFYGRAQMEHSPQEPAKLLSDSSRSLVSNLLAQVLVIPSLVNVSGQYTHANCCCGHTLGIEWCI